MAAPDETKTVKAVVAKGRSVHTPDGLFGPGEEVVLPRAEIGLLRMRGYLVDPDAKELPLSDGPVFKTNGVGIGHVA